MDQPIAFAKLSGSGNDFICIDARDGRLDELAARPGRLGRFAQVLCDRHTGVDMAERFPERASQERLREWFVAEEARLGRLLEAHRCGSLVELYEAWMAEHLVGEAGQGVRLGLSSSLFACEADKARVALLEVFVKDYERAAALYNEALAETDSDLHPLRAAQGELPFFAVQEFQGRLVRTAAHLEGRAVRQIARDWQLRRLDYWDSRGALLPWAIALGGKDFYDSLIARAEIYQEGPTSGECSGGRGAGG